MNNFDILGRCVSEISDLVEICMKKVGFGYNEFALFYSLYFSDNGKCTQKQVSDDWFLPKQTVFNVCKDYRQKGWIELSESEDDKRERIVRLTQEGRRQVERPLKTFEEINSRIFNIFGKKNTAQLFASLEEFREIYKKGIDRIDVIH